MVSIFIFTYDCFSPHISWMLAGLHPYLMRGADVAVFVGSGVNELEQRMIYTKAAMKYEGYTVMGTARTMFANRISYFFDFKG